MKVLSLELRFLKMGKVVRTYTIQLKITMGGSGSTTMTSFFHGTGAPIRNFRLGMKCYNISCVPLECMKGISRDFQCWFVNLILV